MEAVPRMPMIWLDLKEAGEFPFSPAVRQVSWAEEREATGPGQRTDPRDPLHTWDECLHDNTG